jgi:hypothetical protein
MLTGEKNSPHKIITDHQLPVLKLPGLMRNYLLLLLFPMIIICCSPETDPPKNLIDNPGFEAVGLSGPSGWTFKSSGSASPAFLSGVSEIAHRENLLCNSAGYGRMPGK